MPLPLVACALVMVLAAEGGAQRPPLTAAPQLARVYDAIFDARFDDVPALLATVCPIREREPLPGVGRVTPGNAPAGHDAGRGKPIRPAGAAASRESRAPEEVCQLLDLVSLWWQVQLDPETHPATRRLRRAPTRRLPRSRRGPPGKPARAEAWFYLGGAYGARAQWRALRGERLAAARDGKRIKEALERALAARPGAADAYFGIGLYHYYADVARRRQRCSDGCWRCPAATRCRACSEMLRARRGGQLLRDEADYQLHLIYLWYEQQPERALELLRAPA